MALATSDTASMTLPMQLLIPFTMPLIMSTPHVNALEARPLINPTALLNPDSTVL